MTRMLVKPSTLLLLVVVGAVLLLGGVAGHTSVIGVDFGSEFIKVYAATKEHTVDIVLNEQTRRKSNTFVGFRGEDRWFGEDARNLAARFPLNMIAMVNRLVGLGYDRPEDQSQIRFFHSEMQFPFHLSANPKRGSVDVSIPSNPNVTYSAEVLLGMMLAHIKDLAEKSTEAPPHSDADAVFILPRYLNPRQRQAFVDAAVLAGIKVVESLSPTTATAAYFGMMHQGFGNETKHVVIFDMGSTKTEVGVFTFSPPPNPPSGEKRVKLAHSLGTMTVRHIASDSMLGGRTFDACIATELERQFKVAHPKLPSPLNGTTLAQFKSGFSLFRAAGNLKEQLSANTAAPIKVEGIAPDKDFQTKMSREEFEQLCSPLFARAIGLAKEAVERSGVPLEEISRFELMGGGSRLPKLILDLGTFYGRPVDRTLNTDESAAMGAAYYAASESGYRVRSFRIVDHVQENYDMLLSPKPRSGSADPEAKPPSPPAPRDLFVEAAPGSRRSIVVRREDDFSVFLRYANGTVNHCEIRVSGIPSALEALDALKPVIPHENNTFAVRLELKMTKNGLIVVDNAQVKVTYAANVTKRVKVEVNTGASANASSEAERDADGKESAEGDGQKDSDESGAKDEGAEGANAGEETTATTSDSEAPKVEKKWVNTYRIEMRRRTRALHTTVVYHEKPLPLDSEDIIAAKAILAEFEAADERKRQLAHAKNELEAYIQLVRGDGLLENEEVEKLNLLTDDLRASIAEAATKAREWLEDGDGSSESTPKEQYEEQLKALKVATAPVMEPYEAHKAAVAEALRNATLAKKKAAEEAAKAAKKGKAKDGKGKAGKGEDTTATSDEGEETSGKQQQEPDQGEQQQDRDTPPNEEL